MIKITDHLFLDEKELHFDYLLATGPGGQNVNKVSSAVQLRYNVRASSNLPDEVKGRLTRIAGRRMNSEGFLLITARSHRTQEGNRQEALRRLVELIQRAAARPKVRRKTKPTLASQHRRLEAKRRRSQLKRFRQGQIDD